MLISTKVTSNCHLCHSHKILSGVSLVQQTNKRDMYTPQAAVKNNIEDAQPTVQLILLFFFF